MTSPRSAPDVEAFISIDPRRRSGEPCVNVTRIPAEILAGFIAAGDPVDFIAASYSGESFTLPREAVLVACWYQATYGTKRWRKRWGAWAEVAHAAMWNGRWADVEDPPRWTL